MLNSEDKIKHKYGTWLNLYHRDKTDPKLVSAVIKYQVLDNEKRRVTDIYETVVRKEVSKPASKADKIALGEMFFSPYLADGYTLENMDKTKQVIYMLQFLTLDGKPYYD